MNKYLYFTIALCGFITSIGCNNAHTDKTVTPGIQSARIEKKDTLIPAIAQSIKKVDLTGFVPKTFVIADTIYGDLNNDSLEDCVLVIKGTDPKKFFKDEYRGILDRNRRGIIVLLKENDSYRSILENRYCFSSENEDGGNYYAPELYIEINKGKLYINYEHGRYGSWKYTFRFQAPDFVLTGYDQIDNRGPVTDGITSINYLTKKKIVKENISKNAESGDEVFKETVATVRQNALLKLSAIKDFDELDQEGLQ